MLKLILTIVLGLIALAIFIAVVRILADLLVRVFGALIIAVAVGIIVGVVATNDGFDGGLLGFAAALLAFLIALIVGSRWRDPIAGQPRHRVQEPPRPAEVLVKAAEPIEHSLGLTDADALITAWEVAERLAPHDGLDRSRQSCAQFLAAFDTAAHCDSGAIDLAIFIRRHVPGLISDTRAILESADAVERRETIAKMVAELHLVGEDAELMRVNLQDRARDRLSVRLARFANRARDRGGWQ